MYTMYIIVDVTSRFFKQEVTIGVDWSRLESFDVVLIQFGRGDAGLAAFRVIDGLIYLGSASDIMLHWF